MNNKNKISFLENKLTALEKENKELKQQNYSIAKELNTNKVSISLYADYLDREKQSVEEIKKEYEELISAAKEAKAGYENALRAIKTKSAEYEKLIKSLIKDIRKQA